MGCLRDLGECYSCKQWVLDEPLALWIVVSGHSCVALNACCIADPFLTLGFYGFEVGEGTV